MPPLAELRAFVTAPLPATTGADPSCFWQDRRCRIWLGLAIACSLCFSLLFLQQAFLGENVIQDDARQHVFWMARFRDPALFPNDPIADYFQSVAPPGYSLLYGGAAALGLDPLLFNKLLPPLLALVAVGYCFGFCLELLPVPGAAFGATLLLSQSLCFTDTLVSGIQKAFIYPLLFAFLYYLVRRRPVKTAVAVLLLGGFYPQMMLVAAGTLVLQPFGWHGGRLGLSRDRRIWQITLLGLGAAVLVLLPLVLAPSDYGPVVTEAQARQMPEFFRGGRSRYFRDGDPWAFWMEGRSGLRLTSALTPATNALGLGLPLLLRFQTRFKTRFPLVLHLRPSWGVLPRLLLASGGLFWAAHAVAFRLHLPSRYSGHSLRLVLCVTAGLVLGILWDGALGWAMVRGQRPWHRGLSLGLAGGLTAALLLYPLTVQDFPIPAYSRLYNRPLYDYFRAQPPDSLIASLSGEADNLPTLSQRSVLVALDYAIPYHLGYYRPFRQRMLELIDAQYSPDPAVVRSLIERYGVDFWLLDFAAFEPDYIDQHGGLGPYQPAAAIAQTRLQQGQTPALVAAIAPCTRLQSFGLTVLEARCILEQLAPVEAPAALALLPQPLPQPSPQEPRP